MFGILFALMESQVGFLFIAGFPAIQKENHTMMVQNAGVFEIIH
jgi:hypothetical protein